jgi:hypothetical protein
MQWILVNGIEAEIDGLIIAVYEKIEEGVGIWIARMWGTPDEFDQGYYYIVGQHLKAGGNGK